MTTFTTEDRENAQPFKELYFPNHKFVIRLRQEGNELVWRISDKDLELFRSMIDYGVHKELTDEEIQDLKQKHIEVELFDEGEYGMEYNVYGVEDLIREVEAIHGIGEKK